MVRHLGVDERPAVCRERVDAHAVERKDERGEERIAHLAPDRVGRRGAGLDLSFVEEIPGARILQGNIEDESILDEILDYFGRKVNTVICDLSPQVSGNWSIDHAKQISLNYDCTKIMDKVLQPKGNAVFKVFDGEYSMEFRDFIKKKFARVNLTKPPASRKQSSELYFVCLGYRG